MAIYLNELRALPAAEKLRLVEMLWDDLGDSVEAIPLPEWVQNEAARRHKEMVDDPSLGLSHQEVWDKIDKREPTDPNYEAEKGRVALWLDVVDLVWLSQHCCCPPVATQEVKDRCARIRFRSAAALHKSGNKGELADTDRRPC